MLSESLIWISFAWTPYFPLDLISLLMGFPGSSAGKESTCNAGDPGSIPGSGSSPGEGISYPLQCAWASLVAQMVKNLPATWETWFSPWVGKIPWRRAWQPTPVFLPGESLWTEDPGGPQSMGLQRVRCNQETKNSTSLLNSWSPRRNYWDDSEMRYKDRFLTGLLVTSHRVWWTNEPLHETVLHDNRLQKSRVSTTE